MMICRGEACLGPKETTKRSPGIIGAIVGSYKSAVSRRIRSELGTSSIWQRNYYEHIIRYETDMKNITDYIGENPKL